MYSKYDLLENRIVVKSDIYFTQMFTLVTEFGWFFFIFVFIFVSLLDGSKQVQRLALICANR